MTERQDRGATLQADADRFTADDIAEPAHAQPLRGRLPGLVFGCRNRAAQVAVPPLVGDDARTRGRLARAEQRVTGRRQGRARRMTTDLPFAVGKQPREAVTKLGALELEAPFRKLIDD